MYRTCRCIYARLLFMFTHTHIYRTTRSCTLSLILMNHSFLVFPIFHKCTYPLEVPDATWLAEGWKQFTAPMADMFSLNRPVFSVIIFVAGSTSTLPLLLLFLDLLSVFFAFGCCACGYTLYTSKKRFMFPITIASEEGAQRARKLVTHRPANV